MNGWGGRQQDCGQFLLQIPECSQVSWFSCTLALRQCLWLPVSFTWTASNGKGGKKTHRLFGWSKGYAVLLCFILICVCIVFTFSKYMEAAAARVLRDSSWSSAPWCSPFKLHSCTPAMEGDAMFSSSRWRVLWRINWRHVFFSSSLINTTNAKNSSFETALQGTNETLI